MTRYFHGRRDNAAIWCAVLLLVFLLHAVGAVLDGRWYTAPAYIGHPTTRTSRPRTRYFSRELWIPPLQKVDSIGSFNSNLTTHAGSLAATAATNAEADLPVVYTNDPRTVSRWLSDHVPRTGCTLGFDVESVPDCPWMYDKVSFHGPATVQLATTEASMVVHLVRRCGRPSDACVPILESIFRDETIVKAGCSVDDDFLELREWLNTAGDARSRFDLAGIGASSPSSSVGLKRLAFSILGLRLPKPSSLARSDWSKVPLAKKQLKYGARDAWVAAAIARRLATCDPGVFGTEALVDRFRSQSSLECILLRKRRRKEAREQLRSLARNATKESTDCSKLLSLRKSELVAEVEDNSHELELYDVTRLGFRIVESKHELLL